MNKNLFIYSFKYLAVLLALVTFSSCERDEFTEADAFALQQEQDRLQNDRDIAALDAQDRRIRSMMEYRRGMDSLIRINSGGAVYYTVNVVPGGSSAFSSGRFEEVEGLSNVKVTVTQFNGNVVDEVPTESGLATFKLYSGEVTVKITSDNHTDVSYTANLTPDGGVPNGSLVYVGNVIPVFDDPNNPSAESEDGDTFAMVEGFMFAETDITFGNNVEETVPDGTKVRAFIDVANPAFKTKYIDQANDEGTNIGGQPTRSGAIQRFAYEQAASTTGSTRTTGSFEGEVGAEGGKYELMVAATASGLPITMKFSDFAADRTYFFGGRDQDQGGGADNPFGIGTKRFIYTQNTQNAANTFDGPVGAGGQSPTPTTFVGDQDIFSNRIRLDFDLVQNEATATASLTGGDAIANVTITDGGYYYVAPTVTFGAAPAGGTTATGTAILGDIPAAGAVGAPAAGSQAAKARDRGMKQVVGINLNGADGIANNGDDTRGSGYTGNPTITFTRKSFTGRNAAGIPVPNGTGSVAAASSTITYIRIINGGFGMTGAGTSTGVGNYTGTVPAVVFNNNIPPNGVGANIANATVIIDNVVGTATEVVIGSGGDGYDDNSLAITFNYGSGASVGVLGTSTTPALFRANAAGELQWNLAAPSRLLNAPSGEVTFNGGSNYTFVPSVTLVGLTAPAGATLPTFAATVVGGVVTQIEIQGASSGWTPNTEFTGTINIASNPDNVAISAEGFTEGGSIDTYTFGGNYGVPPSIYKSSVEAAGATFQYLTADAAGNILVNGTGIGTAVAPATTLPVAEYAANSDYIFVFENPTSGTSNAWGYPIFDNGGNNVVGLLFAPGVGQGIGYTAVPAAGFNFWILPADLAATPGAALAKYAQLDMNPLNDANANATATRSAQTLTLTFTDGGLGYAIRPEFIISGGQRSAEDLAVLNTSINGVRGQLNFNSAGSIINTSVTIPLAANTFTQAGLAAEPISVTASVARLEAIFNREVNWQTNIGGWEGGIQVTTDGNTDINPPAAWVYDADNGAPITDTPLVMFNELERNADNFIPADLIGSNGATNTDFKYITPPTYTLTFFGVQTGGAGVAVLDPNTADIIALRANDGANGTFPPGITIGGLARFSAATNDPSTPIAGERFRTIGGPSNFEVFSGLRYIRDANYGTGIELE